MEEHIYRLMVEQTRDYAVFALDPEGRIMSWNAGAQLIKGYRAEEIIGKHFSVFYTEPALEKKWPQYELEVAAREGRFEDSGWRLRKDGTRFWASVVITALRDENGKLIGFSKITRDLTERQMQEEALRQSEERFRLLLEGVVDYAIFMLDTDGIVTSWNAGAQRIKGYTREEIVGKHFSRFYDTADVRAGKPSEALATARRMDRAEYEGWRLRKNGERFWARVVISALRDAEGKLLGFAKVTQDLSERRHLRDLEQASKQLTEFIAVLAHELKNPLAPIRSAVQIMNRAAADDPAQQQMRAVIDRQSAHLSRIVDDLVDVSRINRGVLKIERTDVDLAEVVQRAIETAMPAIEARGHRLEVELAEHLTVQGDIHRLTQLVTNLLNNAARYTPPGGNIRISSAAEGSNAVLRLRDDGMGIEQHMLERIFDMFVRSGASQRQEGGGLGIGLALSRRIAELHGGSLEAASKGQGKGSEFTLRVPLIVSAQDQQREPQAAGPVIPAAQARRVLIVDDNVDAATALGILLKTLGHETCVTHDGLTALELASSFTPDIVLLDIGMPELDGYEVAKRLRALQPVRPFRIVAVTGWGQQADRLRARDAGFDAHLVKPVEIADLMRLVDESSAIA